MRGAELCYETVNHALKAGYRVFDTAQVYRNESDIGNALEKLLPIYNLKREDIFITTKIEELMEKLKAPYNHAEKCVESIEKSLSELRTEYVDLLLIHWPGVKGLRLDDPNNFEKRKETWQVMEKIYTVGKAKLIGVSNYNLKHLEQLFQHSRIKPHWLQSEFHPFLTQQELVEFCKKNSMVFQAYSSLGTSDEACKNRLLENPVITKLAMKYSKSSAQILLKWAVAQNIPVIPKSTSLSHLSENMSIFDFGIDSSDMLYISSLNQNEHLCWNPDTVL